MGEIIGIGVSHFPGFAYPDEQMAMRVKLNITSDKVAPELRDPKNWPAPMQAEWSDDEGIAFAARHRQEFLSGVRRLRSALDDFKPDLVLIFGDDQYENFREEIIPPFCVYILDEVASTPYARARGGPPQPNVWGEPDDKVFITRGHPEAARYLTRGLLENGFDIPYAYKLRRPDGLGHAFIRTVQYLDYDRIGWDYPIIPFHVNAYGSSVIRNRGGSANLFTTGADDPNPQAPSPQRCFEVGQAVARLFRASPWRVALVGSSSWSHAFLTEKNSWVYPDVSSDRQRFKELEAGNYTAWRDLTLAQIEDAGQNELLNWIPLVGAMHELDQRPVYCELVESYLMNSCKYNALFPPRAA